MMVSTPEGLKILLGRRSQEPKVWWTIGRTIRPGEAPSDTVHRTLKEEFELEWSREKIEERMQFICINSNVFSVRDQPPEENGRHCLVVVFSLETEEQDIEKFVVSSTSKYREMKWFFVSEVDSTFDPVIQATVKSLKLKLDTG
ncbi:MAG: NUDIX hydrolase [bacterium]